MWDDEGYLNRQRRAVERDAYYRWRRQYDRQCMLTGPELAEDGHTLLVPSNIYRKAAARFWRAKGFEFDGDHSRWVRDANLPLSGKRYSVEMWLERTRIRFYEFYPEYRPARAGQNAV